MEFIKPSQLPAASTVGQNDALVVDNGGIVQKATPKQVADAGHPIATEAQAAAGTSNSVVMTPLTTAQAFAIRGQPYVDQAEAWAESPTNPDPSDPSSRSSKSWAEFARDTVGDLPSITDEIEIVADNIDDIRAVADNIDAFKEAAGSVISRVAGTFVAEVGQTEFMLPKRAFSTQNVSVWRNGARQRPATDLYPVYDYEVFGDRLVFSDALDAGDSVDFELDDIVSSEGLVEAIEEAAANSWRNDVYFDTRDAMVAAWPTQRRELGQVFWASGVPYEFDGSANIGDLPGLSPSGDVTPWHFGMEGVYPYRTLGDKYPSLAAAQSAFKNITITTLSDSIDWAALQSAHEFCRLTGRALVQPSSTCCVTRGVRYHGVYNWTGEGFNADVNAGLRYASLDGSVILAVGTGPKEFTARGVTDERTSGGVVTNTDPQFGAVDATFSLASYYNNDATSTQGATPKLFSSAVYIPLGTSGGHMSDIRVLLSFDGVEGYRNTTTNGMGDDWDVGIYIDNGRYMQFDNVQAVGYWRINGLLIRAGATSLDNVPSGVYTGAEENKFYNCVFQGWKSLGIRGIGMLRAMAVTATYIDVPWADNHPFQFVDSSTVIARAGEFGTDPIWASSLQKVATSAYGGMTHVLRFNTPTDRSGVISVGQPILPNYTGNGVAGTVFRDCRFHGMYHSSGRRISDPFFANPMSPSACLEISGARVRGPRFESSKLQTTDDIGPQLHQTIDVMLMPNMRFEGSTPAVGSGGLRCITTPPASENFAGRVRETLRVQLHMEQDGGDFTPQFGEVPSKFSTTGFWYPNQGYVKYHSGIVLGDNAGFTAFKEYFVGGWTVVPVFDVQGDATFTGVIREASYEVSGEWISFNIYYSAIITHSTSSGKLTFNLPRKMYEFTSLRSAVHVNSTASGLVLPADRTHLGGQILPGESRMSLISMGSGVVSAEITAAHITSGQRVTLQMSGQYRKGA